MSKTQYKVIVDERNRELKYVHPYWENVNDQLRLLKEKGHKLLRVITKYK